MDRFVLEAPVDINGRDFWGRKASVRLEPIDVLGWYWQVNGVDVLLDPTLLASRRSRVSLVHDGRHLEVFEHLGALRFSGLDSVRIVTESSWLPYDGSSLLFWKKCAPLMRPVGVLERFCVSEQVSVSGKRSVSYAPRPFDTLAVDVFVDYPRVGQHRQTWNFPHPSFGQVARVKTQGWPPWRHPFAEVATWLGWPHGDSVVWPQEQDPFLVRRLFARHRALDILGTFSVLCPPGGILTGSIISRCAGHAHDIELVQKARVHSVQNVKLLFPAADE